jgi:hypothetical protein
MSVKTAVVELLLPVSVQDSSNLINDQISAHLGGTW